MSLSEQSTVQDATGQRVTIAALMETHQGRPVTIRCPQHDDGNPSALVFRASTNKTHVHCHACQQTWQMENA